jgi:hypothetical protein
MTLEADAIRAVIDTHADLEAWFARKDVAAWNRFEESLADDFTMITPDGVHCDRATVLTGVAAAGGSWGTDFTIRIEAAGAHIYGGDLAVVVYREVQTGGSRPPSVRWSTALFSRAPDGRMLWRHLHECWTT